MALTLSTRGHCLWLTPMVCSAAAWRGVPQAGISGPPEGLPAPGAVAGVWGSPGTQFWEGDICAVFLLLNKLNQLSQSGWRTGRGSSLEVPQHPLCVDRVGGVLVSGTCLACHPPPHWGAPRTPHPVPEKLAGSHMEASGSQQTPPRSREAAQGGWGKRKQIVGAIARTRVAHLGRKPPLGRPCVRSAPAAWSPSLSSGRACLQRRFSPEAGRAAAPWTAVPLGPAG